MSLPGFFADGALGETTQHYASNPSLLSFSFPADSSPVQSALGTGTGGTGPIVRCPPRTVCCGGYDDSGCNGDCCAQASLCTSDGTCCLPPSKVCQTANGSTTCTNLANDPQNCGACGVNCTRTNGVCSGGTCHACGARYSACGNNCCRDGSENCCSGVCRDVTTDPNNCGACGHSCNGGTCSNGQCANCPTGFALCGGTCVNVQSDANNCGGCGNQCNPGVGCFGGLCHCPGTQSWGSVSNQCVQDPNSPPQPLRQYWADIQNVPSGWDSVDTCYCTLGPPGTPMATQTPFLCKQHRFLGILTGVTGYWNVPDTSCCTDEGLTACGGACEDLSRDPQNCGSCGHACPGPTNGAGGFPACVGGRCTVGCDAGFVHCSSADGDFCCPQPPANAVLNCSVHNNTVCTWTCETGYTRCGNACVDLKSDPQHCGSCARVCPSGVCHNGVCQPVTTCSGIPVQNAQYYTFFVESLPSMCQVGFFSYLANSQAEAERCAQSAWPSSSYLVGSASGVQTFDFAVVCGQTCATWTVAALSADDARSCVQNDNQNCSVEAGSCP